MPMFPDAWMSELLTRSDIVSVVSEYTKLAPKGQRLWGLCPFHGEKTASFSVTADKQLYYCFGCHAGGNVIHFMMEMEKLPFAEAVRLLAQRAGMELPEQSDDTRVRQERARRERLYAACKEAAKYYHEQLLGEDGKDARAYLGQRSLSAATVRKFGLGYAKPGWENLCKHLTGMGYREAELIDAGLAIKSSRGDQSCYDAYRDRVIFPIIGTNAKVLGFGARAMGDEQPKYLNTGDTPIFNKRDNLYALNTFKGKRLSDAVVVEGYMDVISLHQAGVVNAVASLGTALTASQTRLLKRYVPRVYLCYDGDPAGQNATKRALDVLAAQSLSVRVIVIPNGMDPDDYVKKFGKEAFESLKDAALTDPAFRLEHMASCHDLSSEDGREAYAMEACALIATLQPVEQDRYYTLVARKTGFAVSALKRQGAGAKPGEENRAVKFRNTREKKPGDGGPRRQQLERMLLGCIAGDYDAAMEAMRSIEGDFWSVPAFERFSSELLCAYAQTSTPNLQLILSALSAEDAELVAGAIVSRQSGENTKTIALDCIRAIERMDLVERIRALNQLAEREEISADRRLELVAQIAKLTANMQELSDRVEQ